MIKYYCAFISLSIWSCGEVKTQNKKVELRTIAFYNVENLFDTKDDPHTFDNDFTPEGKYRWTEEQYARKIGNIAKTIADIGKKLTKNTPDIIGLSEIENSHVLDDLIVHPALADSGYSFIHKDSEDRRGIDVALLYKKSVFQPWAFKARNPRIIVKGKKLYTRDILLVTGSFSGETMSFVVNHWPSRFKKSDARLQAAAVNRIIFDSLRNKYPRSKIIGMGDFNDNPDDDSLKKALITTSDRGTKDESAIYNPMESLYERGIGTLFYRGKPFLFDQIVFSANLLHPDRGFSYFQCGIFNDPGLLTPGGKLFRSFKNKRFTGGYSDHFPVYILLERK